MSCEIAHASARTGDLVVHDNGSIYWKTVHHMSWIDDDHQRQYAANATFLLTSDEQVALTELAAKFDQKEIS